MIECDEQASHGHVRYYGGLRHARRTTRSIRVVASWTAIRPRAQIANSSWDVDPPWDDPSPHCRHPGTASRPRANLAFALANQRLTTRQNGSCQALAISVSVMRALGRPGQ